MLRKMPYIINGEMEGVILPPFATFFQKNFENVEKKRGRKDFMKGAQKKVLS